MFKKILIANRGEIACRVMATAKKMGIATVAVYSEADRDAPHVAMADEGVCIGPPTVAESYLVADRIIEACHQTGAEAVHPGYGFLSENAAFSERLAKEGITFVGPGAKAISAMGDKITSKRIAEKAKVNTIPGHTDVVPSADEACIIAEGIGYPVMIKASAGGGGKGMRIAANAEECRDGFERATSEARSSFGDDRVFIEKFIEQPRHIEIQVIADNHGNAVALNERECSIQRRHQKIIEEAPSPFLDAETRKAMGEQAVALARAVDYSSAGTVEFVVDGERNFYFLEMNTRLQVEHPVTEMITGFDLVELMIRVASNEELQISQDDVPINGWAMESRVYAESPYRNFLPSTGRIRKYQPPANGNGVRVDTGVEEGSEISMFYDPMIAKLVTWGEDRGQAIDGMRQALARYYIRGVDTNIPFLAAIMDHPRFISGDITTNFIAEAYPEGFAQPDIQPGILANMVAVMASIHHRLTTRAATISNQVPGYARTVESEWVVVMGEEYHETEVRSDDGGDDGGWSVSFGGQTHRVQDNWQPTEAVYSGNVDGEPVDFQVEKNGYGYDVSWSGNTSTIYVLSQSTAELNRLMPIKVPPDMSQFLLSPMPGLLVSLRVAAGDQVKAGQELAVIEAMKMENSLRAEQDGVVQTVLAEAGAVLEVDQPILQFEGDDPE